ncbi:BatA domain-containing protein [Urechidicola vernalis]|uniref:BatA domain-containing protein n=1 Tax=Urechidicola vernalis TaxID=3075600 RepID=A0ABU2Y0P8_9FLAO|nr:BatA domain-containing protein [Urechidicola sp. P050]MDT0551686.1 BatA domain-containing protein [Urechidicola sp. P050]
MQFKHPEILYALLLLIIPIIVHLFQLQRFVKVPFTNVKFLKKIALETRKSSRLKKWLILTTRMLLFASIIFAFSQPYFSQIDTQKNTHTIIYLDNSKSLSYKYNQQEILKNKAQEIIEILPLSGDVSFFTNDQSYKKIKPNDLKNILINLDYSVNDLSFKAIELKIDQLKSSNTNTLNNIVLITDFQNNKNFKNSNVTNVNSNISFINTAFNGQNNIYIDSVYVLKKTTTEVALSAVIKSNNSISKNISISLFNEEKLIGKTTALFDNNTESKVDFEIPSATYFEGTLRLEDEYLAFDNSFFFTLNNPKKIDVLSLGNKDDFLVKIYTKNEFNYRHQNLNELNFDLIKNQHLIILNELIKIPENLSAVLSEFSENGGSIVIIPSRDSELVTYNSFFNRLKIGKINSIDDDLLEINQLMFDHPIFSGVFENEFTNFQYPYSNKQINSNFFNENPIIKLENGNFFLSRVNSTIGATYWFNTPLNRNSSNLQSSPLIVPIFYNFGKYSFTGSELTYTIGNDSYIDIAVSLQKDRILKIQGVNEEFIPLQQVLSNKVRIQTKNTPSTPGFYKIKNGNDIIKTIAFNYSRKESKLDFTDINEILKDNSSVKVSNSIKQTFTNLKEQQEIKSLFRWFLTLSILFLLLEICILKYFKV